MGSILGVVASVVATAEGLVDDEQATIAHRSNAMASSSLAG
jgi:hypothetical protein